MCVLIKLSLGKVLIKLEAGVAVGSISKSLMVKKAGKVEVIFLQKYKNNPSAKFCHCKILIEH